MLKKISLVLLFTMIICLLISANSFLSFWNETIIKFNTTWYGMVNGDLTVYLDTQHLNELQRYVTILSLLIISIILLFVSIVSNKQKLVKFSGFLFSFFFFGLLSSTVSGYTVLLFKGLYSIMLGYNILSIVFYLLFIIVVYLLVNKDKDLVK